MLISSCSTLMAVSLTRTKRRSLSEMPPQKRIYAALHVLPGRSLDFRPFRQATRELGWTGKVHHRTTDE